jgi:hypothetical protein
MHHIAPQAAPSIRAAMRMGKAEPGRATAHPTIQSKFFASRTMHKDD